MNNSNDFWVNTSKVPSSLTPNNTLLTYISRDDVNSIVDFGCGEGKLLESFAYLNKEQLGIDINSASIDIASKKNIPNTTFICSDLTKLDLNKSYEIGILQATLTVIKGIDVRLKLMDGISKIINTYLYVNDFLQTPSHPHYYERYKKGLIETEELGSFNVFQDDKVIYQAHHFSEFELDMLLGTNGFDIVEKQIHKVQTRSGRTIDGIELIAKKRISS